MAVKPGDPIHKHLTAKWFNRVDKATLPQRVVGGRAVIGQFDNLTVTVRNHSSDPRAKYESVFLGGPYFDYEKPFDITHNSVVINTTSSAAANAWAILQEPLAGAVGSTARALMKGVTWLQCLTADLSGDLNAYLLKPSEYGLQFAYEGKVEILDIYSTGAYTYFLVNMGNTPVQRHRFFILSENVVSISSGRFTGRALAYFYDAYVGNMGQDYLYSWDGIIDNEVTGFKGTAVLMDNLWIFDQANCEQE